MARLENYEMDKPTPISPRGFATLKIVVMLTMMHIETLIIFGAILWLKPSFFWTVELVIALVLFLRLPCGWINRTFCDSYEVVAAESKEFSSVRVRPMQEAV